VGVNEMVNKKVAIVLGVLAPYWIEPFRRLQQRGWIIQVFVAHTSEQSREYDAETYGDLPFSVKRNAGWSWDLRRLGLRTESIDFQVGLFADLLKYRPDVILCNQLSVRALISLAYGKVASVPVIPWMAVSSHTERRNGRFRETYRKHLLSVSPCVCTNGTDAKEYLIGRLGLRPDKAISTPYCVDVIKSRARVKSAKLSGAALRRSLNLRANVLLYVGQVIPRKGVELFLENVCTISVDVLSTLSIVVIGGQLDEKLKLRLEKQGLHLINIGFVQPRNLAEYYGMADAFVFPTLEDEWGVVINEATAAGLPVLGSQFSGAVTDLVHNGENGYVFDPTNKAEVMRTIERFLRLSPAEKEAFGNRSFVLGQRFDVEHTVANLEFAFRKSLEGRHGIGQDRNVTDGSDGGMLTGP
jgi:hypothetical protein